MARLVSTVATFGGRPRLASGHVVHAPTFLFTLQLFTTASGCVSSFEFPRLENFPCAGAVCAGEEAKLHRYTGNEEKRRGCVRHPACVCIIYNLLFLRTSFRIHVFLVERLLGTVRSLAQLPPSMSHFWRQDVKIKARAQKKKKSTPEVIVVFI